MPNETVRILSSTSLLRNAKVTFSKKTSLEPLSTQDHYYLELLKELYREIRFYLVQFKRKNKNAENRLNNSLIAMAEVLRLSSEILIKRFFESISDDVECLMFIASSFADFPDIKLAPFVKKITDDIQKTKK